MADSNITKRALAAALKELMIEMPFSKISVSDICERCDMNRKSFYYHFKDKYDLMNWIFDMEFFQIVKQNPDNDTWEFIQHLCECFEANRKFYHSALQVQGQNSFEEHFIEMIRPIIIAGIKEKLMDEEITEFHIDFCVDAFFCSIKRWVSDKQSIPSDQFVALLKSCIHMVAEGYRK